MIRVEFQKNTNNLSDGFPFKNELNDTIKVGGFQ